MIRVERFMLPASEVKMVEFLREDDEVEAQFTPAEVLRAEQLLLDTQKKGDY